MMLIMTYVDDVSGEIIAHTINKLLENGAKNYHVISSLTKKGRSSYILLVDTEDNSKLDDLIEILVEELGILGYRILREDHIEIPHEMKIINVIFEDYRSPMKVKKIYYKGRLVSLKVDYEDLKKLQNTLIGKNFKVSLKKLKKYIETAVYNGLNEVDLTEFLKGK